MPSPALVRLSFLLLIAALAVAAMSPAAASRNLDELERYRLDELVLLGTFDDEHGPAACVRSSDGVLWLVRPGAYIGQEEGRVSAVTAQALEFVDLVSDGNGGWLERFRSLRVPASTAALDPDCRSAFDVTASDRASREAEERKNAALTARVRAARMGWQWSSAATPEIDSPPASSWHGVSDLFAYDGGVLVITQRWNAQRGDGGIWFLASPTAALARVRVEGCTCLADVVVRSGIAYWLCSDANEGWSLVATTPEGARTVSKLPMAADWMRLGQGLEGLLVITADSVYRKEGDDWTRVFHSPVATRTDFRFSNEGAGRAPDSFLPRRGSLPVEHGGHLYFPASDDGNGNRLYRLRLEPGAAVENADDALLEPLFGNWSLSVDSIATDAEGLLWIAGSEGNVLTVDRRGDVRLGAGFGDVDFVPPHVSGRIPANEVPGAAILLDGGRTWLADGGRVVAVVSGRVSGVAQFRKDSAWDCWRQDLHRLQRFPDGTFVLGHRYNGVYLLGRDSTGAWAFAQPAVSQGYADF